MLDAAIVGVGWWGRTLLESVQGSSWIRFVRAVDVEPSEELASRYGLSISGDYAATLADPAVAAVVLATPHSLHADQIVAAAEAGKHVFSEKPLALGLEDAERAVAACRDAGIVLGLGTDKRFLPAVRRLRSLVDEGELGEVLHVEGQYSNDNSSRGLSGAWRDSPDEAPGGGMTGPGLHTLDALVSIAGPIASVDAHFFQPAPPPSPLDAVAALLSFRSGATGALSSVRGVPEYFRLFAAGTRGWAEVRGFDTFTGSRWQTQRFEPGSDAGFLLERFAQAAAGGAAFPVSPGSMLETVDALEATITSIAENRRAGASGAAARR